MHPLARLDRRYLWHPFTQMQDWLRREPIVIVGGRGAELQDAHGRKYLDANSSIWTNLHGHNHARLNRAIGNQLRRIAHSSALGLANEPASLLAEQLVFEANPSFLELGSSERIRTTPIPGHSFPRTATRARSPQQQSKVFFSDNGSTALEVALKLAFEFSRRSGQAQKPRFLSLAGGYHGDTVGAVSLGHIDLFHKAYAPLLFKTDQVMAPYCYRCPYNRAKPERADAREYRKCEWECVNKVEDIFGAKKRKGTPYSAFVFEPLIQGAAGMIPQPDGWLKRVCDIARTQGALLIADEVMTGFGRTGTGCGEIASEPSKQRGEPSLFASHKEYVQPDFLCLAKGLTGGYVPMAATITTQRVFDAFLGDYSEFKTFFHGHSFTGNQVGAAAALASLALLRSPSNMAARRRLEQVLKDELPGLWQHRQVGDIRRVGLVAGVELVKNWRTREPFALAEQAGIRVCEAMARKGVLTRPIGNVIVLMPPYCTTPTQLRRMVGVLSQSIQRELGRAGN
jgi:adenosylmethionine-8-amino-7-oxononanoate aminotransferase